MTEQPMCDRCGRPIHDQAYVCSGCATQLAADLDVVAKVAGEATVTVAHLDVIGHGGRRTDPEVPLPLNLGAGADHDAAVTALLTWARHVSEERGIALPVVRTGRCRHASCDRRRRREVEGPMCAPEPADRPTAILAGWLRGQLDWLRHRQEAGEAYDELGDACRLIVRVVDRPAERWYAGVCGAEGCDLDLYPVAGASTIRCRCGVAHDLDERKAWLLEQAEDVLAGASWCAYTLTRLGLTVKAETIRKWAERARLASHGYDAAGRPVYRLGTVRDLVVEMHAEQRERTLRAAVRTAELAEKRRKKEMMNA